MAPSIDVNVRRVLLSDELLPLIRGYGRFIITRRHGPWLPLFALPYSCSYTLSLVAFTLSIGVVHAWDDAPRYEVLGVEDCLKLIGYLGEEPPLKADTLPLYRRWCDLVRYLQQNPNPPKHELDVLMIGIN